VKVTTASGQTVTGQLVRIDDFNVALKDSKGQYQDWKRTPGMKVDIDDPLTAHQTLLDVYTDKDIHDVVRYLESIK